MEVKAQTLVLIDNSLSVSKVNRQIAKLTLEYFFEHSPEDRSYCFMPFSHEFDYAESYTVDYIGLSDMANRLQYENKEISISDVLTETLIRWQESDYACRDIVILTDGREEAAQLHEKDELYYMLQQTDYPVYIIMLDQEDNEDAVVNLNAICRLSEGKLFHTEFEGSDAEVERQVSEALLSEMDKYSRNNWGVYLENESEEENVDNSETGDETGGNFNEENDNLYDEKGELITEVIEEEIPMDTAFLESSTETVEYHEKSPTSFGSPLSYAVIGASLFMSICGVFLSWCLIQKRKKRLETEEEEYRELIRREVEERNGFDDEDPQKCGNDHIRRDVIHSGMDARAAFGRCIGETVALVRRDEYPDNDGSTRLLYSGTEVADMTFEDANNPSKYYKITSRKRITLGRLDSCCDVAFDYDDSVSARHCELFSRDGIWYVKDLDSSNGTFVNGEKVYTEHEIKSGDFLKMGTLTLIVRF